MSKRISTSTIQTRLIKHNSLPVKRQNSANKAGSVLPAKKVLRSKTLLQKQEPPKTRKYLCLKFLNCATKRMENFLCFREDELKVPVSIAHLLREQRIDQDSKTDDEQIERGVNHMIDLLHQGIANQVS
jgi:hypothetical protein